MVKDGKKTVFRLDEKLNFARSHLVFIAQLIFCFSLETIKLAEIPSKRTAG